LCFGSYAEDTDHPWHRLERGEVSIEEARRAIADLAVIAGVVLDPFDVLVRAGAGDPDARETMIAGVRDLRARGLRTALVTNNIAEVRDGWKRLLPDDDLFEVVIDSSEVGVRKPDPRIYRLALDRLGGVEPGRAALLDDAPGNVAAAQAIGMHGILVGVHPPDSLSELDALLEQG
jgi:putative hydrolase of the HAD superfamily